MIPIPQEGLSFSQLFSHSFRLWRVAFSKVWIISLLLALLNVIPFMLFKSGMGTMHETFFLQRDFAPWFALIIQFLLSLILVSVMYHQMLLVDSYHETSLGGSFKVVLKKFHHILIASLLFAIITFVGYFCLLFPGIFLWVALYFFLPLLLITPENSISCFMESFYLVVPHWWRSAVVVYVPMILFEVIWISLKHASWSIYFLSPTSTFFWNVGIAFVILAFLFVVTPWIIGLFSMYLMDLLNRHHEETEAKKILTQSSKADNLA